MPDLVLDLIVERVDLVDEGANTAAFIQLFKRRENENTMKFEDIIAQMQPEHAAVINDVVAKAKAEVPEETANELATAKAAAEEAEQKFQSAFDESETMKSKLKSLEAKPAEPDFEEVMKSMDPSVQEVFKRMQAQKEQAEAIAKELSEKALHEEAVAKAATIKSIPVEEAQLIEVVKNASPEFMEVLKAANKAIEEAVPFEEVGKNRKDTSADQATSDQAWAAIEKRAAVIAAEQGISKQKATGVVIKENPDLYQKYLNGGAN